MKSLYLRIYVTVVAVLLLFAAVSGWVFQRHIEQERVRAEGAFGERMQAWAELIQRSLPGADAPIEEQAAALRDWSQRLRLPLALDNRDGERLAASELFQRRQAEGGGRVLAVRLEDGRTLWILRPGLLRPPPGARTFPGPPGSPGDGPRLVMNPRDDLLPFLPPNWPRGIGLVLLLAVLFVAVAAGAFPVVRRLTRRLESLKRGVERFGAGELDHRVDVNGRDEVAAVASSFNRAAERVEALVRSHKSLLANASHELRSPLARMKMAVSMLDDAGALQRERLKQEIQTNVAELDALVEEVLLASRLDGAQTAPPTEPVDLLALAAEEAARVDAVAEGPALVVRGDDRLLRRALRNLLENARRYGGAEVQVELARSAGKAELRVCDRGLGVPEGLRERIFEPFYRLPGHAEQAGGVGLGLSLVKQIAERHGGAVRCEARDGGGSCFVLTLPA
jgi:signal transduction histidine kinase